METKLSIRLSATPPDLIRLLPLGEVFLGDGREPFTVTADSLELILAAWEQRGNEMVIDYEHQTVQGREAPAAGWVKELRAAPDGLWARVEWTDRAREYIGKKEYRYFSPVVQLGEGRQVTDLLHVALTNFPAITNLPPLVAKNQPTNNGAAAPTEEMNLMQEELKKMLGVQEDKDILPCIGLMLHNRQASKDKLAAILGLEGDVTFSQLEGAVLALKTDRDRFQAEAEELVTLKREQAAAQFEQLMNEGLNTGKIEPAKAAKVREHTGGSVEMLRTFLECASPAVPLKRLEAGEGKVQGSPDLEKLCGQMGISVEQFMANQARLSERGA